MDRSHRRNDVSRLAGCHHRVSIGHAPGFGGDTLYRELEEKEFPGGFQVLCWNWNQKLQH